MRFAFVVLFALAASLANGQTIVVRGPAVISAQDHATIIARRGALVHSQCSQTEGIGMGSTPEAARRACCFFRDAMAGRRMIVEEGIAYSPTRRMYFAVIRYR
jgi:hypothetical protein